MPDPSAGEADDIAQSYCGLRIPSRKAIPNDYGRNEDDDTKYDKFKEGDILVVKVG